MAVSGVTSTNQSTSTDLSTVTRDVGSELGINEFLEILAVQMSHQDPLEPMEDTDFIAQMAQFSALQQMTALYESFVATQAYSLVGRDVSAKININGLETQIYGKVSAVVNESGTNYLQVGDFLVTVDQVLSVHNTSEVDSTIAQGASLVGKEISAEVPDENDLTATKTVTGTVKNVIVKNGALYVKLEESDAEIPVSYITSLGTAAAE